MKHQVPRSVSDHWQFDSLWLLSVTAAVVVGRQWSQFAISVFRRRLGVSGHTPTLYTTQVRLVFILSVLLSYLYTSGIWYVRECCSRSRHKRPWASICSQSCDGPFPFPPLSFSSPPLPFSAAKRPSQTQLGGVGVRCKLPQRGPRSQTHFGCI